MVTMITGTSANVHPAIQEWQSSQYSLPSTYTKISSQKICTVKKGEFSLYNILISTL